ncbi:MAG: DUF7408 domain-containing protein [Chloroflexota bacterium]
MLQRKIDAVRLPLVLAIFVLLIWATPQPPTVAQVETLISLDIDEAGFGGLYRPDRWVPLKVTVTNRGDDFDGRVVVRPETSGSAVNHTFSAPITTLSRPIAPATETSQTLFLYILLSGGNTTVRVELLTPLDQVAASEDINLRALAPRDSLYVSVPVDNDADLTEVRSGGYNAFQTGWSLDDVPDQFGGLDAVDAMVFSDVDTGALTTAQRDTIRRWVEDGGHLIVTGGDNQAQTASGLVDLLPFEPTGTETIDDLSELARLGGDYNDALTGTETLITTGSVTADGRVLAGTALPLATRRELGNGTVDYLTVSPNLAPLNSYRRMDDVWLTLLTSTQAHPHWNQGVASWDSAQTAVGILPGIDLLPPATSLIAFLGIYILLIGPANYYLLARLNRRGYAWITIPLLIGVFSVLAYTVGFQLRGNTVTLSRLSIVQSWPNAQEAHVDQLVGLLAPRRGDYTIAMTDTRMMRPLGSISSLIDLDSGTGSVTIEQFDRFAAVDFPVDASFIAAFNTQGTVAPPDISGTATTGSDENGSITVRGVVRNDSDLTLSTPVILARGLTLPLGGSLAPGDIIDFDTDALTLIRAEAAVPNALEMPRGSGRVSALDRPGVARVRRSSQFIDNAQAIMSALAISEVLPGETGDASDEEIRRRQAFLEAFITDLYQSTGRGNDVYLVGWTQRAPTTEEVDSDLVEAIDSTLYIIALNVQPGTAFDGDPIVAPDQFAWFALSRGGVASDASPVGLELYEEAQLAFRFTPLPGSVLAEVEELAVYIDRQTSARIAVEIELWDWRANSWEQVTVEANSRSVITEADRFIGPLNAVQVRTLPRTDTTGPAFITRIGFEQRGTY